MQIGTTSIRNTLLVLINSLDGRTVNSIIVTNLTARYRNSGDL